jgi:hypothetical protein
MGRRAYPKGRSLLITADSGESNGARTRLWKWESQKLANESGLRRKTRGLTFSRVSSFNPVSIFGFIPFQALSSGSLHLISYARPGKLFTAHKDLFRQEIDCLTRPALDQIIAAVISVLTNKA